MIQFRRYGEEDHEAVCSFLIELCRHDTRHINWNWARFEWMAAHPEFNKDLIHSIGLWTAEGRVVGAAVYDMYFGEAFCGALPEYAGLYPEILCYACRELKDETGLGVAICDDCPEEIRAAEAAGFVPGGQSETVMSLSLDRPLSSALPEGLTFAELDQREDACALQWLFWQGFDHGTDRAEFERSEEIVPRIRPHFDRRLSVAAADGAGEPVSYCCLWLREGTGYAYVEPVCTIPSQRGKGAAKAVVSEALGRARALGAKRAYVLSDLPFYEKLGFRKVRHFTFYHHSPAGVP